MADIRMPDGTLIRNVPEGVSQQQMLQRLRTAYGEERVQSMLGQNVQPQTPAEVEPQVDQTPPKTGQVPSVRMADDEFEPHFSAATQRDRHPTGFLREQAMTESSLNPKAVSDVGAQGLMQIMPETAKELGVTDPFDPAQSVDKGSAYLRKLIDQFDGDVEKGIAAYHSGQGNVRKWEQRYGNRWKRGLGPQGQQYVDHLGARYEALRQQDLTRSADREIQRRAELDELYPDRLTPKQVAEEITSAGRMAEYNRDALEQGTEDLPAAAQANINPSEARGFKVEQLVNSGKYTPQELMLTQDEFDLVLRQDEPPMSEEEKALRDEKARYYATMASMGQEAADQMHPEAAQQLRVQEEQLEQQRAEALALDESEKGPENTIRNWAAHGANVFKQKFKWDGGSFWEGIRGHEAALGRVGSERSAVGQMINERIAEEYPGLGKDTKRQLQEEAARRGMSVREFGAYTTNRIVEKAISEAGSIEKVKEAYEELEKTTPRGADESTVGYYGNLLLQNSPQAVYILAGMATGSPMLTATLFGTDIYSTEYGMSRVEGRSHAAAQQDALVAATIEGMSEMIPVAKALKAIKQGDRGKIRRLAEVAGTELVQEVAVEAASIAYDMGYMNAIVPHNVDPEDLSAGQIMRRLADAGVVGMVMGGVMSAPALAMMESDMANAQDAVEDAKVEMQRVAMRMQNPDARITKDEVDSAKDKLRTAVKRRNDLIIAKKEAEAEKKKAKAEKKDTKRRAKLTPQEVAREDKQREQEKADQSVKTAITNDMLAYAENLEKAASASLEEGDADAIQTMLDDGYLMITKAGTPVLLPAGQRRLKAIRDAQEREQAAPEDEVIEPVEYDTPERQRRLEAEKRRMQEVEEEIGRRMRGEPEPQVIEPKKFTSAAKRREQVKEKIDQKITDPAVIDALADEIVRADEIAEEYDRREAEEAKIKEAQMDKDYAEQLETQDDLREDEAYNLARLDPVTQKGYKGTRLGKVLRQAMNKLQAEEKKALKQLEDAHWRKLDKGAVFDIGGAIAKGTKDYANLVKVGALRLATAGTKYSAWAADMVGEFGESIKPVLAKVYHDAKKIATDILKVTHEKFATGDRKGELKYSPPRYAKPGEIRFLRRLLSKLAAEGELGRYWYEKTGEMILKITGGNLSEARKLAGLLAIYSSGTGVGPNLTNALKMWAMFQAGNLTMPKQGTKAGRFTEQDRTAIEWLKSDKDDAHFVESFGDKRFPFFTNIMRKVDPKKYDATGQGVTIDLWMMRAFGYDAVAPTGPQFAFATVEVRMLAEKLGWENQQVQAAIWVAIKARWEFIQKAAKQDAIEKGLARMKDGEFIVTGVNREEQITNEKAIADLMRDTALKQSVKVLQKKLDDSAQDFADYMERHYAIMSWEAEPSVDVAPDFNSMPIEDKLAMQAEIEALLVNPKTGREYIAEWLGLLGNSRVTKSGAWNLSVGVTAQNTLVVPPQHKSSSDKIKSSQAEAVEAMNGYAAIMGYLLKQDGIAWHRPYFSQTKKTSNGVEVAGNLDREKTVEFYGALVNTAKEMAIPEDIAMEFAPVVIDGAVRVFNFTKLDNVKFHKLVDAAAAKVGLNGAMEVFQVDGGVVGNNWKDNPKGEDYVQTINNAKNPEIKKAFGRAKRQFAKGIADINAKYAKKHGSVPTGRRAVTAPVSLARILQGGEQASAEILTRFGTLEPGTDTTDQLKIYNLDNLIENPELIDQMAQEMGYEVKVFSFHEDPDAGVEFVLPRLKKQGYEQGYVWIYDPRVADASFKDVDYTRAWRVSHEIGHAVAERFMEAKYGPSKRYGRLGRQHTVLRGVPPKQKEVQERPLTLLEAQRAVEWEDVAFRTQREILKRFGIEISNEQFNKEYAINISDAIYRVLTGEFNNPGERGFVPDGKPVNLKGTLRYLENVENELALSQGRQPTKGIDLKKWRKTPLSSLRSALKARKPVDLNLKLSEGDAPRVRIKENELDEFEVRMKSGDIYYAADIDDAIGTARLEYGNEYAIDIVDEFYELYDTIEPVTGPPVSTKIKIGQTDRADQRMAVDEFMDDLHEATQYNPISPDERVFDGTSAITVRPQQGAIWLDSIRSFDQGHGWGNNALQFVLGLADLHGLKIHLFSKPFGEGGLNQIDLNDWYARNGFVRERGSSVWIREPVNAELSEGKFSMFGRRPKRKTNEGWGVPVRTAEQYAKVLSEQLDITNIEVVESVEDLPDNAYDKLRFLGIGNTVRGLYDESAADGPTIYVIANNIWNEDVTSPNYGEPDMIALVELLLHETVGHFGLSALLDEKAYNSIMDSIRKVFRKDMEELVPRFADREKTGKVGQRLNAEEYFAYTIQGKRRGKNLSKQQQGIWDRIKFEIRKFLIRMGWADVNDAFIESLMDRVIDFTRNYDTATLQKRALQNEKMRKANTRMREVEEMDGLDMKFSERSQKLKKARKADPDLDRFFNKIGHSSAGPVTRLRDWWELRKANIIRTFEIEVFDQFAGIRHAEQDLGIEGAESGYMSVRLTTGVDVVVRSALENGVPVWDDEGTVRTLAGSRGLVEILAPIAQNPEMIKLFEAWLVARRAKRLKEEGLEKLLTRDEIKSVLDLVGKDKNLRTLFEETARDMAEFKAGVLDFAQEAGIIDGESRKLWEHHDHVPFYRVIAGNDKTGAFAASRIGHLGKTIHRLKGGTDPLKQPMESIVQNLSMLIEGAMKNRAMADVVKNFNGTGIVTKAPQAVMGQAIVPLKQVRDMLWEAGVSIDSVGIQMLEGIQRLTTLEIPNEENVVSVQENGKKQYYFIHDKGVMRGMAGVSPTQWHWLMTMLRVPKRVLTLMITRMPDFILKNWFRDMWHTYMLKRAGTIVPVYHSMKGWAKAIAEDKTFKEVLSGGGIFDSGYVNATDPKKTNIAIRKALLAKGRANILDTPGKLAKFYTRIANGAENAHRLIVYQKTLERTGSRKRALFESRDLMDFSVRGANPVVRFLTETVPFWGARVQGIQRTGKSFKEAPLATALRAVPIVLASVALYAINRDDERYKSLNDYEKRMYYHFYDVFEDGDHWRLPKPFEVGAVFSTIPEIITEYSLSQEPDKGEAAALGIYFVVREMLSLAPDVQALNPMLELWTNENSFTEAPIISASDERKVPELQYGVRTSKTVKELAQAMPDWAPEALRSPKQLEHLLRGYLGSVTEYGLFASDYLYHKTHPLEPGAPTPRKDEMPFIKAFMREERGKYDEYLNTMYDTLEEANKIYNSINTLRSERSDESREMAQELEEENEELLQARRRMSPAANRIRVINQRIRRTYDNKKMSPEEKREKIDRLLLQRSEVARGVYDFRPGGKKNKATLNNQSDSVLDGIIGMTKKEQVDALIAAELPHTAILINDINISKSKLEQVA